MRAQRVPVQLDEEVYNRLRALAEVQGAPVTRVINNALIDWMDTVGDVRLEAVQEIVSNGRAVLARSQEVLVQCDAVIEKSRVVCNA